MIFKKNYPITFILDLDKSKIPEANEELKSSVARLKKIGVKVLSYNLLPER